MPRGILLEGPPGVGKTLIAKSLAGESKVRFQYINGSELEGMYVGQGRSNIVKMFEELRKGNKTVILFIDEFDSIAGKRSPSLNSSSRVMLNQLLTEMDGFTKKDNIIIIASTNYMQKLDPAVLRPGRFDKVISIPYPAMKGRKEILEYYIKKTKSKVVEDSQVESLAKRTAQMTGADLKNLVNIASLNAIKFGREMSTIEDFDFAIDRMIIGMRNQGLEQDYEQ